MAFRNILISNHVKLSVKNGQLLVEKAGDITPIPLEDIFALVVDEPTVYFSTALLCKLANFNILLFVCDEKHLPHGIFQGFQQHSRQYKVVKSQLEIPKPLEKQVWQAIIKQKIINQARTLEKLELEFEKVENIAKLVKSGDSDNREGYAAKVYFEILFSRQMTRRCEHVVNSALNYAYAVVRGAIARELVGYGFLPCIGINHESELNNFNLADDFIEPFRPLVDYYVLKYVALENDLLVIEDKRKILEILTFDVSVESESYWVMNAVSAMVKSFSTTLRTGTLELKMPTFL
ncbi:MAG: type II CRISPR-associated endonuclease Cas1 [Fusobacteria bacterium]|nr:type II CRISPR-associated endonuclease Cas1 [Fusobacteriota bacterium]